jgi:hypothetical protein
MKIAGSGNMFKTATHTIEPDKKEDKKKKFPFLLPAAKTTP